MSLEMPGTEPPDTDLITTLGATEESSDWRSHFLRAVHGGNEDKSDEEAPPKSPELENAPVTTPTIIENTEIQEFQVPVCQEATPEWSVLVASGEAEAAWSQLADLAPAPLHLVEGREDPEDEGICVVSPPPPASDESGLLLPPPPPAVLGPEVSVPPPLIPAITQPSPPSPASPPAPPSPEKLFFAEHNIMKWVIDDQDQTELPDLVQRPAASSSSSCSPQPRNYVAIKPKTEIQSYLETFRAGDAAQHPAPSTSRQNK